MGRRADSFMPVHESEAIILRTFPLGEGDRLISFFSRSEGRLRGVAAGARKPKSRFGSTLEPLSYIRIWFYERETRELVRIQQCELIESFMEAQREYVTALAFAVISETTEAILGEREPAEANFRLLLVAMRAIKAGTRPALALAYFAFWSVRLGGWMPRLDRCANCGAELQVTAYLTEQASLVCSRCNLPGQISVSTSAFLLCRRMSNEKLDFIDQGVKKINGEVEVLNAMFKVIECHIEKRLQSRKALEEFWELSK